MVGMGWFLIWSIAIAVSPVRHSRPPLAVSPLSCVKVLTRLTSHLQNMISIFLFRAFQGAGAGAAIPSALGIIGSTFPPGPTKVSTPLPRHKAATRFRADLFLVPNCSNTHSPSLAEVLPSVVRSAVSSAGCSLSMRLGGTRITSRPASPQF